MKLILSLSHLWHNSGGAKTFSGGGAKTFSGGGKKPPLPPPRKIPDIDMYHVSLVIWFASLLQSI